LIDPFYRLSFFSLPASAAIVPVTAIIPEINIRIYVGQSARDESGRRLTENNERRQKIATGIPVAGYTLRGKCRTEVDKREK